MPWTLEKHGMNKDDYNVELHDGKSFIDLNDPKVLAKIVKCVNMHSELVDIINTIRLANQITRHLAPEFVKRITEALAKAEAE